MSAEKASKYYVRHSAGNGFFMQTVFDTLPLAAAFAAECVAQELEDGNAGQYVKIEVFSSVE